MILIKIFPLLVTVSLPTAAGTSRFQEQQCKQGLEEGPLSDCLPFMCVRMPGSLLSPQVFLRWLIVLYKASSSHPTLKKENSREEEKGRKPKG